jgi:hypothetical protein
MNYLLDVLGSTVIAGIIMLMLFNLNTYQSKTRLSSDSELQMQQNAKTLAGILNHDLRKIGYEYPDVPFIHADSQSISFYSDINRDGTVDIVSYFTGSENEAMSTANPRDKILYRVVNNDTLSGPSLGLTNARFSYLDRDWNNTSVLSDIRYVRAELWVESIEKVGGYFIFTYWEMTINPRNL